MGGLAAVIALREGIPTRQLASMLSILKYRGDYRYGISDGEETTYFSQPPKQDDITYEGKALIGYAARRDDPSGSNQPIKGRRFTIASDGEIYLEHGIYGASKPQLDMNGDPHASLERFLEGFDGSYSILLNSGEIVYAVRDLLGIKPLYYGSNSQFRALSSDRKALWRIGIRDPVSFPPGCVGEFSKRVSIKRFSNLFKEGTMRCGIEEGASMVASALEEAVEKRLLGSNQVAVAFSGGLDSSLLAYTADRLGVEVSLYSAMVEGASEVREAIKSASLLGLPLNLEVAPIGQIMGDMRRVLWFIEEPDRMKFEVSLPLYWAACRAYRDGFKVMLSGQGSDELFGGYRKYLDVLASRGPKGLDGSLKEAVASSYRINFERDEPVLTGAGLEGRFPYADRGLVAMGLRIPSELNISGTDDDLRKRVLREAALRIGLPRDLALKPKKSTQYGSGVHNALTRIAKEKNTNPRGILEGEYGVLFGKVDVEGFDGAGGIFPA